jgi:hypothetical protein
VQRSYATRDCTGAPLDLLEAYLAAHDRAGPLPLTRAGGFLGFPAGCGDCAAPKLLHAAAARGWRPEALVEFYFGAPPRTATKAKAAGRIDVGARGGSGGAASSSSSGSDDDGERGPGGAATGLEGLACVGDDSLCVVDTPAWGGGAHAQVTSRVHGRVYGACDKCTAILGTMLHGLDGLE